MDKQLSEWLSNIELANDRTALDLAEKLFKTELRTIYLKFFHVLINEVKSQFRCYCDRNNISSNIRVSLKIVSPVEGKEVREWEVFTVYRDQETFDTIGVGDTEDPHLIKDNTAFDAVAYHLEKAYCSNDLVALGGKYRNTSRRWEDKYNATMVVPIRYLPEKSKGELMLFGFLAVDSNNADRIDLFSSALDSEHMNIMGGSADIGAAMLTKYMKVEAFVSNQFSEKRKII